MAQHADRHNQSNNDNGLDPANASAGDPADAAIDLTNDSSIDTGALADLLAADPANLTVGERVDSVLALAKLRGQVEAALTRSVGAFDVNVDYAADGSRSTASWIAARTELSHSEAKSFWQQARDLRSCPIVGEAYGSGVLGSAKVRALCRAKEGVGTLFAEQEADVVEVIRHLTVRAAEVYLARWRQTALATANQDDGPAPDDPADNSFHVSTTFHGRRAITGDLDVIGGATFQNHLAAEVDRMFATGEFRSDDGLLPSQRNAIALLELCRRGAERSSQRGEARPSIHPPDRGAPPGAVVLLPPSPSPRPRLPPHRKPSRSGHGPSPRRHRPAFTPTGPPSTDRLRSPTGLARPSEDPAAQPFSPLDRTPHRN
ncbi:MAG: DUF222 domain-containing protein [Aquihabitans sp.]